MPHRVSKALTNGEAAKIVQRLPPDALFGRKEDREALTSLYRRLRPLYSRPRVAEVKNGARGSGYLDDVSCNFTKWCKDPGEFWEGPVQKLPKYAKVEQVTDRRRIFLNSAVELDAQLEGGRILQRFVAVSAYELFQRVTAPKDPKSIWRKHLVEFLNTVQVESSDANIKKYGDVVRRGKRWVSFCRQLKEDEFDDDAEGSGSEESDELNEAAGDPSTSSFEVYGILFESNIQDTNLGRNGLYGDDKIGYIKHLRDTGLAKVAREKGANKTARILLDYHQRLLWIDNEVAEATSCHKRRLESRENTPNKRMRRVSREMNDLPSRTSVLKDPTSNSSSGLEKRQRLRSLENHPDLDARLESPEVAALLACSTNPGVLPSSGNDVDGADSLSFGSRHAVHSSTIRRSGSSSAFAGLVENMNTTTALPRPDGMASFPRTDVSHGLGSSGPAYINQASLPVVSSHHYFGDPSQSWNQNSGDLQPFYVHDFNFFIGSAADAYQ